MKTNLLALGLIVVAALWRVAIVYHPALFNVAPVTAFAFCGAAYFRDWRWWLLSIGALTLSDLWLNHYYATQSGFTYSVGEMLFRAAAVAPAVAAGWLVSHRRTALTLLAGAVGGSLVFYLATNSLAWLGDAYYAKTLAGWWQALTVGHPDYPSTVWFFRNTLVGDLAFTSLFSLALGAAGVRGGAKFAGGVAQA